VTLEIKTKITNMKIKTLMALVLTAGTAWFVGGCRPEVAQQSPPEPFNAEQTQGDVKVVLLEVAQLTVFTDKWHSDPQASGVSAAPAFKVTCLIEVPATEAASALVLNPTNSVQVAVEGKSAADELVPGISGGSSSSSMGFEQSCVKSYLNRPQTPAGRTALVEETVLRGMKIDADHVDLSLTLNWKKKDMVFEFKDVPVN